MYLVPNVVGIINVFGGKCCWYQNILTSVFVTIKLLTNIFFIFSLKHVIFTDYFSKLFIKNVLKNVWEQNILDFFLNNVYLISACNKIKSMFL